MLKNKEIKCLLFFQIMMFLFLLGIGYGIYKNNDRQYKFALLENNRIFLSAVSELAPDIEQELIESILSFDGNTEQGTKILEKYGLDDLEQLDYFRSFQTLKSNLLWYQISFLVLSFGGVSFIYLIFLKREYSKVNEMSDYMNKVLHDDYSFDIRDYEEGDISNLKNEIYKVTNKLKEQMELLNEDKLYLEDTLSDISHQIKTPLTSMYVINDLLLKDDLDKDLKREFLSKNKSQLERIEWLVTSLLKMSRLDSGSVILKEENVDVLKLIKTALEPVLIPIELKNITLSVVCDATHQIIADFHWTVEVLVNIIKNAYEHTREEGKITISVTENPLYTAIIIEDNGIGIKKEDLPHIFERFYKGSGNKESIGIGLNMAKKIMDKQKGDLEVTSKEGQGTCFQLKFYKNIV